MFKAIGLGFHYNEGTISVHHEMCIILYESKDPYFQFSPFSSADENKVYLGSPDIHQLDHGNAFGFKNDGLIWCPSVPSVRYAQRPVLYRLNSIVCIMLTYEYRGTLYYNNGI